MGHCCFEGYCDRCRPDLTDPNDGRGHESAAYWKARYDTEVAASEQEKATLLERVRELTQENATLAEGCKRLAAERDRWRGDVLAHSSRSASRGREETLRAQVAQIRDALGPGALREAKHHDDCTITPEKYCHVSCRVAKIRAALAPNAGRSISEELRLLREVEAAMVQIVARRADGLAHRQVMHEAISAGEVALTRLASHRNQGRKEGA